MTDDTNDPFLKSADFARIFGDRPRHAKYINQRLDDFLIKRHIGSGGAGIVFEAEQLSVRRRVALKVLDPEKKNNHFSPERFQREAQSAARLEHPYIVPIYASGAASGVYYYAMKLIEGPSLRQLLISRSESGGASLDKRYLSNERQIIEFIIKVARALHHAHEKGVIHRDVNPNNILVEGDGTPVIVDFGIAKDTSREGLTSGPIGMGTLNYMSPEQLRGNKDTNLDRRTDVYSLGMLLYETLSGRHPFGDDHTTIESALFAAQRPLPLARAAIPAPIAIICGKALRDDPKDRYQTAREFAEDLERYIRGESIVAKKPAIREKWNRYWGDPKRARRAIPAVLAAGLLLGLGGIYIYDIVAKEMARPIINILFDGPADITLFSFDAAGNAVNPTLLGNVKSGNWRRKPPAGPHRFLIVRSPDEYAELYRDCEVGSVYNENVIFRPLAKVIEEMSFVSGDGAATAPFYIDRAAVTVREYADYCKATNRPFPPESWADLLQDIWRDDPAKLFDLPMTCINWPECRDYAEWAGKRLPTGPEYEAALSRGGWLTKEILTNAGDYFNINKSEYEGADRKSVRAYLKYARPARAGQRPLGPFQLYHSIGNVCEWTTTLTPPDAFGRGTGSFRYIRGFPWHAKLENIKLNKESLLGFALNSGSASPDIGFRCVKSVIN